MMAMTINSSTSVKAARGKRGFFERVAYTDCGLHTIERVGNLPTLGDAGPSPWHGDQAASVCR
jgi:hypothetical protein